MTPDDLRYDHTTPDAARLVLPVTLPDGTPFGSLHCSRQGRPGKQQLCWQSFRENGQAAGPIWPTRDEAAANLCTGPDRLTLDSSESADLAA